NSMVQNSEPIGDPGTDRDSIPGMGIRADASLDPTSSSTDMTPVAPVVQEERDVGGVMLPLPERPSIVAPERSVLHKPILSDQSKNMSSDSSSEDTDQEGAEESGETEAQLLRRVNEPLAWCAKTLGYESFYSPEMQDYMYSYHILGAESDAEAFWAFYHHPERAARITQDINDLGLGPGPLFIVAHCDTAAFFSSTSRRHRLLVHPDFASFFFAEVLLALEAFLVYWEQENGLGTNRVNQMWESFASEWFSQLGRSLPKPEHFLTPTHEPTDMQVMTHTLLGQDYQTQATNSIAHDYSEHSDPHALLRQSSRPAEGTETETQSVSVYSSEEEKWNTGLPLPLYISV
ncbi:hypothetical protein KIPB_009212, partial [Kipferlia bialata]